MAKYGIGAIVIYKASGDMFKIINVTNMSYTVTYYIPGVHPDNSKETYPHHFIEGYDFELSLKQLLKEL